jgi:hypothetical protein
MTERLIGLLVTVSGLAALAGWLLVERQSPLTVGAGAVIAAIALLGIIVLVRAVVVLERRGAGR